MSSGVDPYVFLNTRPSDPPRMIERRQSKQNTTLDPAPIHDWKTPGHAPPVRRRVGDAKGLVGLFQQRLDLLPALLHLCVCFLGVEFGLVGAAWVLTFALVVVGGERNRRSLVAGIWTYIPYLHTHLHTDTINQLRALV